MITAKRVFRQCFNCGADVKVKGCRSCYDPACKLLSRSLAAREGGLASTKKKLAKAIRGLYDRYGAIPWDHEDYERWRQSTSKSASLRSFERLKVSLKKFEETHPGSVVFDSTPGIHSRRSTVSLRKPAALWARDHLAFVGVVEPPETDEHVEELMRKAFSA